MKKTAILLTMLATMAVAQCQVLDSALLQTDTTQANPDTARAAQIIDRYLQYVDFDQLRNDSMLCVVTDVVVRGHTSDTMWIYRWYMPGRRLRIEMWQKGRIESGYYTDGKSLFREFDRPRRVWRDMTQNSFYDLTMYLDIRGALYGWRSKGSEPQYMGQYEYNGHPVDRLFVASPNMFDRNYFFEQETGLLFLVTEDEHIYGDAKKAANAQRVDWRAWHEFVPLGKCMMPSVESYQADGQVVIMHHHYHWEKPRPDYFTNQTRPK